MTVRITRNHAVDCRATLALPLRAISVWGQIRDFHQYARQDFFHAQIAIEGETPRPGANLVLHHRYVGVRLERTGRILVWREGVGYSFSDLSPRGPKVGFPHVFSYRIEPVGENGCHLHILVRGRWTARRVPRWAARLWLWWVFGHVVRSVSNRLMFYRVWRGEGGKTR